jgi:hypothetical protein
LLTVASVRSVERRARSLRVECRLEQLRPRHAFERIRAWSGRLRLAVSKTDLHIGRPAIESWIRTQNAIRCELDVVFAQSFEPVDELVVLVVVITAIVRHHDDSRTRCHRGSVADDDVRGA